MNKIMKGFCLTSLRAHFVYAPTFIITRGHSIETCVPFAKTNILQYSFCNKIIPFGKHYLIQ